MNTLTALGMIERWAYSFIEHNPKSPPVYRFTVTPRRPPVQPTQGLGAPGSNYAGFVTTLNTGTRIMVHPVEVGRVSPVKNKVEAVVAVMFQSTSFEGAYGMACEYADKLLVEMASLGQFCLQEEGLPKQCVSLQMRGDIKFGKPETPSTERHKSEAGSVKLLVVFQVCADVSTR